VAATAKPNEPSKQKERTRIATLADALSFDHRGRAFRAAAAREKLPAAFRNYSVPAQIELPYSLCRRVVEPNRDLLGSAELQCLAVEAEQYVLHACRACKEKSGILWT